MLIRGNASTFSDTHWPEALGSSLHSVSTGTHQYYISNSQTQRVTSCTLLIHCIARAERDGTRAEARFRLSPKRTSPFKSVGAPVQSTAGRRGVRMSLSNAGLTTIGGGLRLLATHSIRQFPLHSPPPPGVTVCHNYNYQVQNELYHGFSCCCPLTWSS